MINLVICLMAGMLLAGPADVGDVDLSLQAPSGCPTGLAFDGQLLWMADRRVAKLFGVDPETGKVERVLEAPGYWPTGLAFDGEQLWVADREEKLAYRIDTFSGIATRTLELDATRPEGLAWDGKLLWCTDSKEDLIMSLDPADGTNTKSFPCPANNPTGLAFDGQYLWVADRINDTLYRVDPAEGTAVAQLPAPGKYAYGLVWTGGKLWCADYQSDTLDRVVLQGSRKTLSMNTRKARVAFVQELINFGPGMVETADFWMAVPSSGDNQQLLGPVAFEPEPTEFVEDQWGQLFAHFHFAGIESDKRVQAIMRCDVELRDVLYLLFPEKVGTVDDIPQEVRDTYLQDGTKLDMNNEFMKKTVARVVGGEKNALRAVQKIYDYLLDTLHYELVGGWNAAPFVLQRGSGSCSEYTFCFISLCRAAGIPARYAGSLVIRNDDACFDDVFHRWAEVYLPGYGWVPVDASRGDKKLPADQLKGIGWLSDTLLITTRGGGDSKYLSWTYNGDMKWMTKGKCKVKTGQIAEWEPLEDVHEDE